MTKHISVLLSETIEALQLREGAVVVDATLGGGGHAQAILDRIGPTGRLIALDVDTEAIARAQARFAGDTRIQIVQRNFGELSLALAECGVAMGEVDALMADLGFSSDQIEASDRGLSFLQNGPLDMRLDPREALTAADIVNTWDEGDIAQVLRTYGDERWASRIARHIVGVRGRKPLKTTDDLVGVIREAIPLKQQHTDHIHPATRTFQALRIAVNREVEQLEKFLPQAVAGLRSGGRLAIISFHSGEDRIVKHFMRDSAGGCICPREFPICRCGHVSTLRSVTKKPITPSMEEIAVNPRARSAKLRVAEKLSNEIHKTKEYVHTEKLSSI